VLPLKQRFVINPQTSSTMKSTTKLIAFSFLLPSFLFTSLQGSSLPTYHNMQPQQSIQWEEKSYIFGNKSFYHKGALLSIEHQAESKRNEFMLDNLLRTSQPKGVKKTYGVQTFPRDLSKIILKYISRPAFSRYSSTDSCDYNKRLSRGITSEDVGKSIIFRSRSEKTYITEVCLFEFFNKKIGLRIRFNNYYYEGEKKGGDYIKKHLQSLGILEIFFTSDGHARYYTTEKREYIRILWRMLKTHYKFPAQQSILLESIIEYVPAPTPSQIQMPIFQHYSGNWRQELRGALNQNSWYHKHILENITRSLLLTNSSETAHIIEVSLFEFGNKKLGFTIRFNEGYNSIEGQYAIKRYLRSLGIPVFVKDIKGTYYMTTERKYIRILWEMLQKNYTFSTKDLESTLDWSQILLL